MHAQQNCEPLDSEAEVTRETSAKLQSREPATESPAGIAKRVPGCAIAFIVFILALTAGDYLKTFLSPIVLQLSAIVIGLALVHLYTAVVRRRWHVGSPDAIQLLAQDLGSVRRFYAPRDYRLFLPGVWPWSERLLHEVLYSIKWLGHLLVFVGVGTLLYGLLLRLGMVDVPNQ